MIIENYKTKGWKLVDVDKYRKAILDYEYDVKFFENK
jgi:hypothetical protein